MTWYIKEDWALSSISLLPITHFQKSQETARLSCPHRPLSLNPFNVSYKINRSQSVSSDSVCSAHVRQARLRRCSYTQGLTSAICQNKGAGMDWHLETVFLRMLHIPWPWEVSSHLWALSIRFKLKNQPRQNLTACLGICVIWGRQDDWTGKSTHHANLMVRVPSTDPREDKRRIDSTKLPLTYTYTHMHVCIHSKHTHTRPLWVPSTSWTHAMHLDTHTNNVYNFK